MQHYTLLERNLIYTAVTRGKKLVTITGQSKALAMAVKTRKSSRRLTKPAVRIAGGRAMNWQVYIILCSDESLYTGITKDIDRRFNEHAEGRGAKYFRGRQPVKVVYLEKDHNRSTASKREAQIKAMDRSEKASLLLPK
jgi:putative endonuclease